MSTVDSSTDPQTSKSLLHCPFHPVVLGIVPILSLFTTNFGDVSVSDLWLPIVVTASVTVALMVLVRLIRGDWHRAAITTSVFLAMFFLFRYAHKGLFIVSFLFGLPALSYGRFFFVWCAVALILVTLVQLRPRNARSATIVFNIFAFILIAVVIGTSVRPIAHQLQARRAAAAATVDEPFQLQASDSAPDIYYLIFDRYGGLESLRNDFGVDNSEFYDQLRRRGFFCAENSHATYPHTKISMASALNMRLLLDPVYEDQVSMIRNHRVGRALTEVGYDYFHLGNWYGPVRSSNYADYTWRVSPYPSYFAEELCRMTPITPVMYYMQGQEISHAQHPKDPQQIEAKFEKIAEISTLPGKKFVYAHFLIPHPPFMFNRDGSHVTPEEFSQRTYEQGYVEQLYYTNAQILKLVDAIQANSSSPPVIVIQADEGAILVEGDQQKTRREKLQKRTSTISAYALPGMDAEALLTHNATPVNTFRVIFSAYFDANLPSVPNQVFYWDHADSAGIPDLSKTVSVVDVTAEVTTPVQAP